AGCIRLFNQDVMDLYERAGNGTRVKVRSKEESLAIDGPYMDDAFGRAVPATEANIAKKAADEAAIVKAEADARAAAEKAEAKRLKQCKRQKIAAEDCPMPEAETAAAG